MTVICNVLCLIFALTKLFNVMILVNTYFFQSQFSRTFDRLHRLANVTVEEYKTVFLVTIQFVGYECPSVLDWRVSKRITKNPHFAAAHVADEARLKGNI